MKIHISPRKLPCGYHCTQHLHKVAADMEPRRQDYDRLDLTRQRKFRTIGGGKVSPRWTKQQSL